MAIEMEIANERSVAAVVRLPKDDKDPCIQENEPFDVKVIMPERANQLAALFEDISQTWDSYHEAFPK